MTTTATAAARCYAGIDPSLTGTGVCILMDGEPPLLRTIATSPKTHPVIYSRLDYIIEKIGKILFDDYDFTPNDFIFIERPFINPEHMNAQQNLLVLSYLIRKELHRRKMSWLDVSPMTLKRFVCGKGKAEKSMMLMKVYQNWNISADDDNQADACGLAHMAKAMEAVRGRGDQAAWKQYQLDVVRDMLAKGK